VTIWPLSGKPLSILSTRLGDAKSAQAGRLGRGPDIMRDGMKRGPKKRPLHKCRVCGEYHFGTVADHQVRKPKKSLAGTDRVNQKWRHECESCPPRKLGGIEMQELDKYDTVRLLITKLWEHKDIPKNQDESILEYSKRVFAYQVGIDISFVGYEIIWVNFAERIFSVQEYRGFLELVVFKKYDPIQAIIVLIQGMKVKDRFALDESDIKK